MRLTAETTLEAERYLGRRDPIMGRLIGQYGPSRLHAARRPPFQTLAGAIIGQQLSVKAAAAIEARVRQILGGPLGAQRLLAAPPDALRAAGLSNAKVRYLHELAGRVSRRELNFAALRRCSDAEAAAALVALPGIGQWTAEMFLIFGLQRANVLSLGDAGLRRAATLLYPEFGLEAMGERWQPYCSVASWYLWQSLENAPLAV